MDPCWICLQEDGQLLQRCACPRRVHADCLAYWQLHSAGTAEETTCRFCNRTLPDWRCTLGGGTHADHVPVVAVIFEGREWRLRVPPTPEGAARFQRQIELITGLPFSEQVNIRFHCKRLAGGDISLNGTRCLEAAVHCAAIHCAQFKLAAEQQQQQQVEQLSQPQPQPQPQQGLDALQQKHMQAQPMLQCTESAGTAAAAAQGAPHSSSTRRSSSSPLAALALLRRGAHSAHFSGLSAPPGAEKPTRNRGLKRGAAGLLQQVLAACRACRV